MLHNEARELLVRGYEATHDAEGIAKAYSVSKWTVYRLAEQKRKTGRVCCGHRTAGTGANGKRNYYRCCPPVKA